MLFGNTYADKNGQPHTSEFNAFMSGATKTPYQCQDAYGVYENKYDQKRAEWNRTHPDDRH